MPKDVNEILNALPEERRKKINSRSQELIQEYLTKKKTRKVRILGTQQVITQKTSRERLEIGSKSTR